MGVTAHPQRQATGLDGPAVLGSRYQILAAIGHGGMSLIHVAAVESVAGVRKLVVLKSLRPELMNNALASQMFLAEGRLAVRLNHANVVQTYEVAMIADRPVIVMEYLDGQPLSRILRRASELGRPFPLEMHLQVLKHALQGLEYAHNLADYDEQPLGIVHRDVSPQNIFLSYDGHTKLLDFGIAKTFDNSVHTEVGQLKGKIRYMAPEQMRSKHEVDRRADIFAAGVVLWEALAGQRLWQTSSDIDVIEAVTQKGIPAPSSAHDDVDPELEAICMRAVALQPSQRYPTALAMSSELDRAIDRRGGAVKSMQLSELVHGLFDDVRARRRDAIGRELRVSGSFRAQSFAASDRVPDSPGAALSGAIEQAQDPLSDESRFIALDRDEPSLLLGERASGAPPARRSRMLAWLALATLFGSGMFVLGRAFKSDLVSPASNERPQPDGQPASPLSLSGHKFSMRIEAAPADATLYLDGVRLPQNPYSGDAPADDRAHELRVEAPGKLPVLLPLSSGAAIDVQVNLKAAPMATPASAPSSRPAATAKPTLPARAAAAEPNASGARPEPESAPKAAPTTGHAPARGSAPGCEPPFYVDDAGIRRIRKECI